MRRRGSVGQLVLRQLPVPWREQRPCQMPCRHHEHPTEAAMLLFLWGLLMRGR
jgi:hypothetical protein